MLRLLEMLTTECGNTELAQRIENRLIEQGFVIDSHMGRGNTSDVAFSRAIKQAASSFDELGTTFTEFEGGVSPEIEGGVFRSFKLTYRLRYKEGYDRKYTTTIVSDDVSKAVEIGKIEFMESHRHHNFKSIEIHNVKEL